MSYSKYVAITDEGKLLMSSQVGGIKLAICGYALIEDYNGYIAQMEDVEELKATTLEDLKNNTRLIVNDKSVKYVIDSDGRVLSSNSTKEIYDSDILDLKNHLFPVTYKMCGETETDKGVIYGDYQIGINKGMMNIQDIDSCDVFFDGIALFGQPYKETSDNHLDVDETQDIALFAICYLGGTEKSGKIQILTSSNEKLDFECDLRIGLTEDNYISDTMFYFDEEYPEWSNNFNLVNRATKDCADLVIGLDDEVTQSQWGDAESDGIYGTEKELFITDESLNTASQSMASPAKVHIMTKPRDDGYVQPQLMLSTASKNGDYLDWSGMFISFTSGESSVEGHVNTLVQFGATSKDFEEPNYEFCSNYMWQKSTGHDTANDYVDSHGNISTNVFYGNVVSASNGGLYHGSYDNSIDKSHWVTMLNSDDNTLCENGSSSITMVESSNNKIAHNSGKMIALLSKNNELGYNKSETATYYGGFKGLLLHSDGNKVDNSTDAILTHSSGNTLKDNSVISLYDCDGNTVSNVYDIVCTNSNKNTISDTNQLVMDCVNNSTMGSISIPTTISHSMNLSVSNIGGAGSSYEVTKYYDFIDYCIDTSVVNGSDNIYLGCIGSSFGENSTYSITKSNLLFSNNLTTKMGERIFALNCNNTYINDGGKRNTFFGNDIYGNEGLSNFVIGNGNTIMYALSTYMLGSNLYWDSTTNRGSGSGESTTHSTLLGSGNINMPDALFVFGDGDSEIQQSRSTYTSAYDATNRHNLLDLRGAGKKQNYSTMNLYNGGSKLNYAQFGCYDDSTYIKFRKADVQCVPKSSDRTFLEICDTNDSTFIKFYQYDSNGVQNNTVSIGDDSTGGNIVLSNASGSPKIELSTDTDGVPSIVVGKDLSQSIRIANDGITATTNGSSSTLSLTKEAIDTMANQQHEHIFNVIFDLNPIDDNIFARVYTDATCTTENAIIWKGKIFNTEKYLYAITQNGSTFDVNNIDNYYLKKPTDTSATSCRNYSINFWDSCLNYATNINIVLLLNTAFVALGYQHDITFMATPCHSCNALSITMSLARMTYGNDQKLDNYSTLDRARVCNCEPYKYQSTSGMTDGYSHYIKTGLTNSLTRFNEWNTTDTTGAGNATMTQAVIGEIRALRISNDTSNNLKPIYTPWLPISKPLNNSYTDTL